MIKVLFFDFGKVVGHFEYMNSCVKLSGVCENSSQELQQILFKQGVNNLLETGLIEPQEFFTLVCSLIKTSKNLDYHIFENIWGNIFFENRDLYSLLAEIKPGIKLFLISNLSKFHWKFVKDFEIIKKYFSHKHQQILSFEVGAMKPNSIIFNEAINRAKTPISDILYFDDVPEYTNKFNALGGNGRVYNCNIDPIDIVRKYLIEFKCI